MNERPGCEIAESFQMIQNRTRVRHKTWTESYPRGKSVGVILFDLNESDTAFENRDTLVPA